MMMTWLKKFVLDILPSVAATIIGAYIVNHYIIPKSPSAQQAAISSTDSKDVQSPSADAKPVDGAVDKASFEKGVAEKTAIEKTAEKAAAEKASADTSDARKHHPAPKMAAKPAPTPVIEERRASDLARAAIERQAKSEAKSEPAKSEAAKAADAPRVQPVSTIASAPPMQPLPPAINVTTPSPDAFEQGNAAPVVRQPYPQAASRLEESSESRRFAPPADIPTRRPLDLRAEAMSQSPSDRTSIADEVVSTAKSMFHAVMPR